MTRYLRLPVLLASIILGAAAAPVHAQDPGTLAQRHVDEIIECIQQDRAEDAVPAANALVLLLDAHPELTALDHAVVLNALAMALEFGGNRAQAATYYQHATDVLRRLEDPAAPQNLLVVLENYADLLIGFEDFSAAGPLLAEALRLRNSLGAYDDVQFELYLAIVRVVASRLIEAGEYGTAETLLQAMLPTVEHFAGTGDPRYAFVLNDLVMALLPQSRFAEAESLCRQALDVLHDSRGTENIDYATVLLNLARIIRLHGNLLEAETLARQGVDLFDRVAGTEHPKYAVALGLLAEVLNERGEYDEAIDLFRRSLDILSRTVGAKHEAYRQTASGLAVTLINTGDLAAAESLLRELMDVYARGLGEDHPAYASAKTVLGVAMLMAGRYDEAQALFREAIEILRPHKEFEPDAFATAAEHLALLLARIGGYDEAESLLREAVELRRRIYGPQHYEYARALNHLAFLYLYKSDPAAAEAMFREAAGIIAATLGTENADYATTINNAAVALSRQGKNEEAIPLLHEAVETYRAALGDMHPAYVGAVNNLAFELVLTGDPGPAEPLLLQATEVTLRAFGPRHPNVIGFRLNLALVNQVLGRPDSALALVRSAFDGQQELLRLVFGFSSEQGMLAFARAARGDLSFVLSMVDDRPDHVAVEEALRWVLLRKGVVLSALTTYRQVERIAASDTAIARPIGELNAVRRQITDMTMSPPAGVTPDSLGRLLANLSRRREALEAELSRSLASRVTGDVFSATDEPTGASRLIDDIRRVLPGTGALVEFVRFAKADFGALGRSRRPAVPHYAALVLRPTGPVHWVPLGEAEDVEAAIRDLRIAHMGCEAGERSTFCSESNYRAAAEEAYLRIFDPLEPYLEGVDQLFVSLDGELNQVPFGALVDLGGQYLIERFRLTHLSSGRDLLRRPPRPRTATGTVVFAGPSFDLLPATKAQATGAAAGAGAGSVTAVDGAAPSTPRVPAAPDALRGLKWEELPGALAEADDVRHALDGTERAPVTVHTAERATEGVFKTLRAPRILHLATHGFFLPDRELSPEERAQCLAASVNDPGQGYDLATGMGRGLERLRCADNPLLRSGIVLAGANAVGAAGAAEDGWVLAEEIAALDLSGTELVVLSACETGLGDVKTGEGVYGLRRAFELAGAERILMSLFKVPDAATRELLAGFYRRLAAGMSAEEALRASQLELREKHPHPFYWASFVLVGHGS